MSQLNNDLISLLESGIRAEGMRQRAISNNVANMETAGYRRMDVKFEDMLAEAMNSKGEINGNNFEPEIYRPENTPVNSNGNDVSFEQEVGEMVKNSLRHQTFTRLLQKKYSQIEQAIQI